MTFPAYPQQQQPFLYPGMYNPGQFAFGNNAEMSQLISMGMAPLLGAMTGPGNFMPHMMPGQAVFDQFTMRNYQNQTRNASFNLAGAQNSSLADSLLGMRSMFTNNKASELDRGFAETGAGILNNPMVKSILGMAVGPDNLEAMLHGSRGDVQNLGNTINRIGYFRRDPGGEKRMDAESLEDLTTGVFSHLYEPQGNVDQMADEARKGNKKSMQKLREAARMEEFEVVEDSDIEKRLLGKGKEDVDRLYKKYVQGGEATDAATQAKELTKFDNAIKESGVLNRETETSVGMLHSRAERLPVDEMHGFMAGQVGQLAENLFQRGVLPPSIGALSGKERVGAIAETKLDDATLERLAQTMARRELESGDSESSRRYREATTDAERQKELESTAATYRAGIKSTKEEADKYARGESSKSAEDILKGTGGEMLAGNVDAGRTASKLKDYTESLSAIRDIFGDNGNPNAPVPALLAVLDQLTQGGMGQMNPAKAATTLRQMQTLARETGTGMQQLAQLSMIGGNIGAQLGLAPSITMQNVAATMGITKSATDRGAFSSGTFGTVSKEQFQQETLQKLQQGDASGNAKSMAALARIYKMDPDRFKGTELEAAMAAYNDPNSDGTYTYKDKNTGEEVTRNLYKDVGRGRQFAAQRILTESGGNQADFYSVVYDPLTQQYAKPGAGYLTQKHERMQMLSAFVTGGAMNQAMSGSAIFENMSDKERAAASEAITGMVMDSADMGPENQKAYLKKHMKDTLKQRFIDSGKKPEEAERMAQEMSTRMAGNDSNISRLLGNMGTTAAHFYGENLAQMSQRYGRNQDVFGMLEVGDSATRAAAHKSMLGYETTVAQRASDYFSGIGKRGEKFNFDTFMKHMAPTITDKEVLKKFAGGMAGGMGVMSEERNKYQVNEKYVEGLTEKAQKGDKAAMDELRRLGNVDSKAEIIKQSDLDAARKEKIAGLSAKGKKGADGKTEESELDRAYRQTFGGSGAHKTEEEKRRLLNESGKYADQFATDYKEDMRVKNNKKYYTEQEVYNRARGSFGQALKGAEGKLEDVKAVERAFEHGQNADVLRAGVSSMFNLEGLKGAFGGMSAESKKKIETAIMSEGNSQDVILKEFGLSKEEYEKGLKSSKKSDKQRAAEVALGLDTARNTDFSQLGKGADGKDTKQNVDKANIDATTVVINADRVEGGGAGTAGTAAAAGSPEQQQARSRRDDINREMNEIEKRKTWFGNFASTEDEKRWNELKDQNNAIVAEERKKKTNPDGTPAQKEDTALATNDAPLPPPTPAPDGAVPDADSVAQKSDDIQDQEKQATDMGARLRQGTDSDLENMRRRIAETQYERYGEASGFKPPESAEQSVEDAIPDAVEKPTNTTVAAASSNQGYSSANINAPQQQSHVVLASAQGGGGEHGGSMTVTGNLNLNGLREAILDAVGQKAVQTPNNGPAVVGDPPMLT